jgi:uncharacterized RDD family membrane protein YckC
VKAVEERAPIVLTPEHVPIRLMPAGLGARFLAVLVDAVLILAVSMLVTVVVNALTLGTGMALAVTAGFVIQWGYHIFFEVRRQGRTPGKRMCGLRVVDARGLPVTFQQSFVRNAVRMLDFAPFLYGVGALACLLDPYQRRLGDIAADTLVIQEQSAAATPRGLAEERRFNTLLEPRVLRRIRRIVGLEEREFLLALCARAESMDPKARFDLLEEVGSYYRRALEVDDPHLSGENLVRGLLAVLFAERV